MTIQYVGVDLAKNVFQICGLTKGGKVELTKRIQRSGLMKLISSFPPCLIGVEACTGAFYWQCEFEKIGHQVKIISPQYVKPFVKGQKNDNNDAQAIAIALMQPTMNFVPPKNCEQ